MYKKKYKLILLVFLLLIILGLSIYIYIFNFNYLFQEKYYNVKEREKVINNIKNTHIYKSNLFDNIEINNQYTYYNELEQTYYFYFDTKNFNKVNNFDIKILTNDDRSSNYIVNSSNYNKKKKIKVTYDDKIKVLIYNDKYYSEIAIKFINIPIINISYNSQMEINNTYQSCNISLYSKDEETNKNSLFISDSNIRIRGGSSIHYPKKSYRLSLTKNNEKNRVSLLGMRTDEDWILDNLYSEKSLIRSKLAFDLWNQINSDGETIIDNDINTRYVVVYLNNEYHGLYLLKEPVDKKTLKLNDYGSGNSGILIKGVIYTDFVYPTSEINSLLYGPYELKYPTDNINYYWKQILDKMRPYFIDNKIDDEVIENTFYIKNYMDYKIFVYLVKAVDNYSNKNIYLSLQNLNKDTKLIYTPWDLDMSFGLTWTGLQPTFLGEIYDQYDNELYLFNDNTPKLNKQIKERYLELRKDILSDENINNMINSYYNDLIIGEGQKNNNKWINADFETEVEKVRDFFFKRIKCFDDYVGDYDV